MAENHTGTLSHLRSPELAVRAFEAEIQFNEALSSFQGDNLPLLAGTDAASFLQAANRAGFSWTIRAVHGDSVELALLHDGGAESAITTTAAALLPTLLGLLGVVPAVHQAAPQPVEPEAVAVIDGAAAAADPASEPATPLTAPDAPLSEKQKAVGMGRIGVMTMAQRQEWLRQQWLSTPPGNDAALAAQSLAVATDGAVAAADPASEPATPLTAPDAPLSEEQKAAAVDMVGAMSTAQRKAFTIAFRNAFSVPREQASLVPLITQIQHLEFIDRFTTEAAGEVAA
jgi:hypothetical protein